MKFSLPSTIRSLLIVAISAALGWVLLAPESGVAQTRLTCSPGTFGIKQILPNNSYWDMCWEERAREGIVLRSIAFTPANGERRKLIAQANLAQIHVPYDDNAARFHDLSDYGLGSSHLNNMSAGDCPRGTLLQNNGRNVLCMAVIPTGYAYKYYSTQKQANALQLFSVSHIGAYNYVVMWTFHDDGTIEPSVGATGHLQLCSSNPLYSWPLGSSGCMNGTSHTHNYYWRIDFDLGGIADNEWEQIEFASNRTDVRPMSKAAITVEKADVVGPDTFRLWRIKNRTVMNNDRHTISYELESNSSHVFRGPSYEPFTSNDVYITQYNPCEIWASHNPTANGCGNNVSAFLNSQTITDPVLWYGVTFHHLARDEDEPHMSPHWSSFRMVPRDMTALSGR